MEVDATGLCAIIRACQKAKVSSLKFGDVEVNFGGEPIVNNVSQETFQMQRPELGEGDVSIELSADTQSMMEDAELADMMISDPEGWETYNVDRLVHRNRAPLNGNR